MILKALRNSGKVEHVAVTEIQAKLSGVSSPANHVLLFFYIKISDQERNFQKRRQIWLIFFSVYNGKILAQLISQNEATVPFNKVRKDLSYYAAYSRKASKFVKDVFLNFLSFN